MKKLWSKVWEPALTILFFGGIALFVLAAFDSTANQREIHRELVVVSDKFIRGYWNGDVHNLILETDENIFYKERVEENIYYNIEIDDSIYFVNTESGIFHSPSHFLELVD